MSHPEKDELFLIRGPQFYSGVMGSPAGEIKQTIIAPSIGLIDPAMYNHTQWDIIEIDNNFSLTEYLDFQATHDHVIRMPRDRTKRDL